MQLTRFTDYALRVLIQLASQQGARMTIREIARDHNISYNHLIKVVHKLSSLGYIQSEKGRKGGITLGKAPDEICIGKVVRDMEGSFQLVDCSGGESGPCVLQKGCHLPGVFNKAVLRFLEELDNYTLSDLL